MNVDVREIPPGAAASGFDAMRELRPTIADSHRFGGLVDATLRTQGYRLVGAFVDGSPTAAAVIGFREVTMLAYGRMLYVDDLSTLPTARRHGLARTLLMWVFDEAHRLGCDQVHLDSGLGSTRADAHRLYLNTGLQISAFHFSGGVTADHRDFRTSEDGPASS